MPNRNPANHTADQLAAMSAEAFLTYLKVNFEKTADGTIIVPDPGINCSQMGLTRLPDLSQVVLTGERPTFWCYKNELTSLDGLPKGITAYINFSNNKITSLGGVMFEAAIVEACGNPIATFKDMQPGSIKERLDLSPQQLAIFLGEHHPLNLEPPFINSVWDSESGTAYIVNAKDLDIFLEKAGVHEHKQTLALLAKTPVPKFRFRV